MPNHPHREEGKVTAVTASRPFLLGGSGRCHAKERRANLAMQMRTTVLRRTKVDEIDVSILMRQKGAKGYNRPATIKSRS